MKLGIIFKKEFREMYGQKEEFNGDEISLKQDIEHGLLIISYHTNIEDGIWNSTKIASFPVNAIQLIYFGGWKD